MKQLNFPSSGSLEHGTSQLTNGWFFGTNGKEIFYLAPDKKLMAADVKAKGSSFEAETPKVLFQTHVIGYPMPRNAYDVSADGQRFLIITPFEAANTTPITVVANWTADLKQ